jgi:outer membrane protein, multidrug efflux system
MRRIVALAVTVSLVGCKSLEPAYVRPEAPVPTSWPQGDAYLRSQEAGLPALTYRDIFADPRLQRLIETALVNNRDLRIAAANIAQARAQYRGQRAERLPEVLGGASARISGTGNSGPDTSFSIDASPSFELDLFGRIRSLTNAELNRYLASEAAARATRLTLIGDIAEAWLTYAADSSLMRVAEATVRNAEQDVRLTRARLDGGIAPRTDLRQAEQTHYGAQADVAEQRTALAQDVNALQLLVGAPIDPTTLPGSVDEGAAGVRALPAGLDSRILLRRPDVVEAEFNLRAANAEIGAARAALFPSISLTGLLGLASNALASLFTGGAFNYAAGASVSVPIFDGGRRRAQVQVTEAQRAAAIATYERAIQTAFREVADALARRGTIGDQLRAVRGQLAAAQDNYNLVQARYRGGISSYLETLDAQRSLYAAQRTLVATSRIQAVNLVDLYRSLGGDQETREIPPASATPPVASRPRG